MPGGGYGVGLFDSKGPTDFAAAIGKITSALTGAQTGFTNFGKAASSSLSGLGNTIDSLIKKLGDLQKMTNATPGGGGGGRAPSSGGGSYSGGSGGTGAGGGSNWQPSAGGGPGGYDQGPMDTGQGQMQQGLAGEIAAQMKDQWGRMPEQTAKPQQDSMVNPQNQQGSMLGRAAGSMIPAAAGALANSLQTGAAGNLVASAIQGASIGQMLAPAYGVSAKSLYVLPNGAYAQNPQDYAQANYYAATQMGVGPGTRNWSTIQGGANQLMTLMPNMTRQQAMVTQNQMNQPGTLNAGLMFGLNFRPGGKMMKPQDQFSMIYQKLFAGFPGGKPTAQQFSDYMLPGGPGENNLAALGITPGSDEYTGFMQYATTRLGMANQGKSMTTGSASDIGTKAGAKAAGLNTPAFAQLQAQTAKAQTLSKAEPGIAGAATNLNNAAQALFKAVGPLSALGGGLIGKIFGSSKGLLGGIPGVSMLGNLGGHLPGVGGIIKSIFQEGGQVPGSGPQLAVVHGGEYVLTKDDVDKMQGKKGAHGGSNKLAGVQAGMGLVGGGGGTHDKNSVIGMLAGKPEDNPSVALSMLLAPPPPGSALHTLTKKGAAPGGTSAVGALTGGTGGGGGTGVPTGTAGSAAASTSTSTGGSPWSYKSAGAGAVDLSGMFSGSTSGTSGTSSGGGSGGTGSSGASGGSSSGGAGSKSGAPSGDVASWISKAMQLTGVSGSDWTNGLNLIIQHESGGNPKAINNWDSNALAGHPSQGLMQEIPSTFQANALPGYNTDITDPVSNIAAGIKYIQSRYKGINNVPGVKAVAAGGSYVGYARGTQQIARTQLALLHRGEAVVPAADNYSTNPYGKGGSVGNSNTIHLNFKSGAIQLVVPANSSQKDMDALAKQFVAAISKPQNLASVRSS